MDNQTVEHHLAELTDLILTDENGEPAHIDSAGEYIESHGLDLNELIEAATEFMQERMFVQRIAPDKAHAAAIAEMVATPAFIIGVMVGLKHGVTEIPNEIGLENL